MQPSFRFKERSILASNFDPLLIQREGQGQIVADGGVASRSAATSYVSYLVTVTLANLLRF